ncbi:MAG: CDP-alcohol phosphatidyltransferase family protein [Lysobacterales bacterium]|nr:MAG: CDP-alcohol phosphatidyltransferase family protein [Xanthomonadales bacterium]
MVATVRPMWVRQLPNAFSIARLLAVPVLFVLAGQGRETAFGWLLIAALLTDIADGYIARTFSLQSRLGAILDSTADSLILVVALYGTWVFHRDVITEHPWIFAGAILLWLTSDAVALWRYRRLTSFHTYLSKVVTNVLGLFVGWLFVFGFEPWLLYLGLGLSMLASLEELAIMRVLPEWQADVPGLWWALRNRRDVGTPK